MRELIAKRLKELRGAQTQEEVARNVGVGNTTWSMYENGERVPRDPVKVRIASYFGKSVQEIFFDHVVHESCSNKKEVG